MSGANRGGKRTKIIRRLVQAAFLAFFVFLVFEAAYPPLKTPPSNLFLRFDPLSGLFALTAEKSFDLFLSYWPAWILLGLTLFSSRFFCGWICPLGTCFDAMEAIKPRALKYYQPKGKEMKQLLAERRRGALPRRIRLKYIVLPVILALSLAGVNLLYFFGPLTIFNRSVYFVLLPQVPVMLVLLLLLSYLYRPRFWCEEICPLGALFSLGSICGKKLKAAFSPLSVVKDRDACISCGACYKKCPFGVDEPYTSQNSGRLRSADCTACGACIAACPADGALALESFGWALSRSRGSKPFETRRETGETGCPPTESSPREEVKGGLTVTRKEFVASLGVGAVLLAGYGVGLREISGPVLRMPGGQDESEFLAACARCGECVRACPTGCIRPMGLEGGFQRLWTPRFDPRRACCQFDVCGQACATVCPSGAIEPQAPGDVRIGQAHLNRDTCLAWNGSICLACKESCRFNAIEVDSRRRPHLNPDLCTGCGACQMVCPNEPASVQVFPQGESPAWQGNGGRNGNQQRRGGK